MNYIPPTNPSSCDGSKVSESSSSLGTSPYSPAPYFNYLERETAGRQSLDQAAKKELSNKLIFNGITYELIKASSPKFIYSICPPKSPTRQDVTCQCLEIGGDYYAYKPI